jgi:hypothetical protein
LWIAECGFYDSTALINPQSEIRNRQSGWLPRPGLTNTRCQLGQEAAEAASTKRREQSEGRASGGFENAASNTRSSLTARRRPEGDSASTSAGPRQLLPSLKREQPGSASHPDE